jgi:hypothetical protein
LTYELSNVLLCSYDADPPDWQIWSVVVDEDEASSGFSSAITVEWFDSNGVTFCCDTHGNRITSIQVPHT